MFLQIARRHCENFNEGRICPDQYLGSVHVKHGGVCDLSSISSDDDFLTRTNTDDFLRKNAPAVILIVESPHVSEFKEETPKPVAGCGSGNAGKAVRELFHKVVNAQYYYPKDGEYLFFIVNAIQYQCSLGKKPKQCRNKVFIECWEEFGEESFKERLAKLYRSGDIIINACTSGAKHKKLREMVQNSIDGLGIDTTLKLEHPANWRREFNTALKSNRSPNYCWKS